MEKKKALSPYRRCKIVEMFESGVPVREIASQHNVSVRSVYRVLKEKRTGKKKKGRPTCLSPHQCRKLVAEIRQNPSKSSRDLKEKLGISASVRTIQRELRRKSFVHVRKRKTPRISAAAKAKRVAFAKAYLLKKPKWWQRVIFSDEKKWNLKGNDGYVSLWVESDRKYTYNTDCRRLPGIMVWAGITFSKEIYVVRMDHSVTGKNYKEMLETVVFHPENTDLPEKFVFQQDNAPAHKARVTKDFLESHRIPVLDWPPYSPDLNIIENLWGIVSAKVYEGGKEYQNPSELWNEVSDQLLAISPQVIQNLYNSIPGRLMKVIELNGERF